MIHSKHYINGLKRKMSLSVWLLLGLIVFSIALHLVRGLSDDDSLFEYAFWLITLAIFGRYCFAHFKVFQSNRKLNYVELSNEHLSVSIGDQLETYSYEDVKLTDYAIKLYDSSKETRSIDSRLFDNTVDLMNGLNNNISEAMND